MSVKDIAMTLLLSKDMEDFIQKEIKEKLPTSEDQAIDPQRSVFIVFANFPGNLTFQKMLSDYVYNNGGTHYIIGDRYLVNKLRGQRYDLLWVDFRLSTRLTDEDVEYIVSIIGPETKRLLVTYNTTILPNYELGVFDMYRSMSIQELIAIMRRDCHAMKIDGMSSLRYKKRFQPLQLSYLLKRAWKRLFRKGK